MESESPTLNFYLKSLDIWSGLFGFRDINEMSLQEKIRLKDAVSFNSRYLWGCIFRDHSRSITYNVSLKFQLPKIVSDLRVRV